MQLVFTITQLTYAEEWSNMCSSATPFAEMRYSGYVKWTPCVHLFVSCVGFVVGLVMDLVE
jgi:hypothetical protein